MYADDDEDRDDLLDAIDLDLTNLTENVQEKSRLVSLLEDPRNC